MAEREWVEVETRSRPRRVVLDPRVRSHDWNMLNNQKRLGGFLTRLFGGNSGKAEHYFHPYFSTRSRRDRMTVGWQPTVWYNDAGGVTLGLRARTDYLGRFEQNVTHFSVGGTGIGSDLDEADADFYFRTRNPVALRAPNASQTLEVFNIEGRYGAVASLDWVRREHLTFGPAWHRGLRLAWIATDDFRYLDPGFYDNVGTVELQLTSGVMTSVNDVQASLRSSMGGGLVYNRDGLAATGRPELNPFYFRWTLEGSLRRKLLGGSAAIRAFAGVSTGDEATAKQRQIYLQGADPLQQLHNPFLRSRGALLVGHDFRYHLPGGANVRGLDPRISTTAAVGVNLEVERTIASRASARLFNRIAAAVFTDVAHGIGGPDQPLTGERLKLVADAGLGLRADHRIGNTRFTTRFDFPLYVSRPELAHDRAAGDDPFEFRWTFSFQPAF
jgi:hypothetical protein